MRIAELLRLDVIDAEGVTVGRIHDVRLVQDGPYVEGFGAGLRVDGLVVGGGSLGVRWGFHRHRVKGPWLLKATLSRLERRARYVDWHHVVSVEDSGVSIGCRRADLPRMHDLESET